MAAGRENLVAERPEKLENRRHWPEKQFHLQISSGNIQNPTQKTPSFLVCEKCGLANLLGIMEGVLRIVEGVHGIIEGIHSIVEGTRTIIEGVLRIVEGVLSSIIEGTRSSIVLISSKPVLIAQYSPFIVAAPVLVCTYAPLSLKADAGNPRSVIVGTDVMLDGSGSSKCGSALFYCPSSKSVSVALDGSECHPDDPKGQPLTFRWEQVGGSAVSLSGADSQKPTFTAPAGNSRLVFRLTVSDGEHSSKTDEVVIKVFKPPPTPPNLPPEADAGENQTVEPGTEGVALDGSGSRDPEGQPLTFRWEQVGGSAVSLSGADSQKPTFTAPAGNSRLVFRLTVSDGEDSSKTDEVVINVFKSPSISPVPKDNSVFRPTDVHTYNHLFTVWNVRQPCDLHHGHEIQNL